MLSSADADRIFTRRAPTRGLRSIVWRDKSLCFMVFFLFIGSGKGAKRRFRTVPKRFSAWRLILLPGCY